MKKSLVALAVIAVSGAAMAQSSVTLYGVVDVNLQSFKAPSVSVGNLSSVPGVSQTLMGSGGQNGSRWGLKGKEDLGGGLFAVFDLQSGFSVDTGTSAQGGLLFGRHAFVGLSGGFGTLTLGRHDTPMDDAKGDFMPSATNVFDVTVGGGVSLAAQKALVDFGNAAVPTAAQTAAFAGVVNGSTFAGGTGAWLGYNSRKDNSIKYQSPKWGGFSIAGLYGLGEDKTAAVGATHTGSIAARYDNGPIGVMLAYQDEELAKAAPGKVALKNTLFGAMYDFSVVKLYGVYNEAKLTGVQKQKEFGLGVSAPIGAFTLRAQVARSKGDDLGKNTGYDVEALYDLSKRTTLYSSYASTKHEIANNERTSRFALGLRHKF